MRNVHAFLLGFVLAAVLAGVGVALFRGASTRDANATQATGDTVVRGTVEVKDLFYLRGCVNCHDIRNTLVGPPFMAVAERYRSDPERLEELLSSLRSGSQGVWGDSEMPAQPSERLSDTEARAMLRWILALEGGTPTSHSVE